MNKDYIKLAKYLDSIGKYTQADNVDNFIKSAQFTAPGLQSGRSMPYTGYLDATAQSRQTSGFGAGLQQGLAAESPIVGKLAMDPNQIAVLSRQPGGAQLIFDYNQKLGEDMANDAAQYTGPNRFQQFVNILSQRLSTQIQDPEVRKQIFLNNLEQPLISELTTLVMSNPIQNVKQSIQALRGSNLNLFPEVSGSIIPTAIRTALSAMSLDTNPQVKQRYNQFIADPEFSLYTQGFNPAQ